MTTPGDPSGAASGVASRLAEIRERIGAACQRSGRLDDEVTLVGASKGQPLAKLLAAHAAGLRVFGENRVQEAAAKRPALPADLDLHLLGPLQSNKAAAAAQLFSTFHAIDRGSIAERLEREAASRGATLDCFLEVNLAAEATKHGFAPAELTTGASAFSDLPHLRLVGLMAIPPPASDPEQSRRWFRELRAHRDQLAQRGAWRHGPGLLSMGMSDDYEVAVEEGATHVRVGTALFGGRG